MPHQNDWLFSGKSAVMLVLRFGTSLSNLVFNQYQSIFALRLSFLQQQHQSYEETIWKESGLLERLRKSLFSAPFRMYTGSPDLFVGWESFCRRCEEGRQILKNSRFKNSKFRNRVPGWAFRAKPANADCDTLWTCLQYLGLEDEKGCFFFWCFLFLIWLRPVA